MAERPYDLREMEKANSKSPYLKGIDEKGRTGGETEIKRCGQRRSFSPCPQSRGKVTNYWCLGGDRVKRLWTEKTDSHTKQSIKKNRPATNKKTELCGS